MNEQTKGKTNSGDGGGLRKENSYRQGKEEGEMGSTD